MEHARTYLDRDVKQEAIDEVRETRRHDEDYSGELLVTELQARWQELLNILRPQNLSLEALMRTCMPVAVENGNTVVLQFSHHFHRSKVAEPRHKAIVEQVISTMLGRPMEVRPIVTDRENDF